jgi:hypothetical protein
VSDYATRREVASRIIAKVLSEVAGQPDPVVRKALRDAYPFGQRKYWPYKVWLDEIARQRGRRPAKLGRRFAIDWNCPECGVTASVRLPAIISTPELMAAIRSAHRDRAPECLCDRMRWSYQGFYAQRRQPHAEVI